MNLTGFVLVSSTRAASGVYEDRTGPVIVEWMHAHGFDADAATVVPDGPLVNRELRSALDRGVRLIVTTGGTGIGPDDVTADATAALVTRPLPGFHEELRRRGAATTPFALMSRGVAGIVGDSFVVNLPGSTGGVRDGLQLLGEVVDHVFDQLSGGRHD